MSMVVCPGCGVELESDDSARDEHFNASSACRRLYDEISAFTFALRDTDFIHQVVVDTYAAQHSGPGVKTITTAFAIFGLYLVFERGYTGRDVQLAHMALSRTRREWPYFQPPAEKGTVTVREVVKNLRPDNYRDVISGWAESVWNLWKPEQENIRLLLDKYLMS